jgi:hypothetical protein
MKLLSLLTTIALAAAAFLFVENQNLDDRFKAWRNASILWSGRRRRRQLHRRSIRKQPA